MFTTALIGLAIFLTFIWFRKRRQKLQVLKQIGIDGPEPSFLLGNITEINKKGIQEKIKGWTAQYGGTFGFYEGTLPCMVTDDMDIIKQVFIKDFPNFHTRKNQFLGVPDKEYVSMFSSHGDTWHRLRSIVSPVFSSARMKEMTPTINHIVERLVRLLNKEAETGQPFDIYEYYKRHAMDVISSAAFGIDNNCLENKDAPFFRHARSIFDKLNDPKKSATFAFIRKMMYIFPRMTSNLISISGLQRRSMMFFFRAAEKIIAERISSGEHRNDFIKLMLEAQSPAEKISVQDLTATTDEESKNVEDNPRPAAKEGKTLTLKEMQAQSNLFLVAGFETTSTALGYITYQLALHPQVQEKLTAEIDKNFSDKQVIPDYTSVQKLQYLDMVINETMRMYFQSTGTVGRIAGRDCTIHGQFIPAGTAVQVNAVAIHQDEKYWGPEDTSKFVPERFSAERKATRPSLAFIPFGIGPRNCVGMRFALLEIKLTLARLLQHLAIKQCDKTKVPLPRYKAGTRTPSEGIYVILEKR